LLLYYGVVGLSRGLTLYLGGTNQRLTASHGISLRSSQSIKRLERPDVGEIEIETLAGGTFPELVNAIGNRGLLRVGSSGVNRVVNYGATPPETRLTLGDMLARLPDVFGQHARWKTPLCAPVATEKIANSSETRVTLFRKISRIDERFATDLLGAANTSQPITDERKVVIETINGGRVNASIVDFINENALGIGEAYLAAEYPSGLHLSKCAQLFAISYALSMLVRYHPGFWMDLVQQRVSDEALPTILAAVDVIEQRFPGIVADFLEE
jgi:hypothetical protein